MLGGLASLCHGAPPPLVPSASVTLPCICRIACQPWGGTPGGPLAMSLVLASKMGSTVLELHVQAVHVQVVLVHVGCCHSHGMFMCLVHGMLVA